MVDFPTTGIFWIDIFIAIATTGTLIAAGLTALVNFLIQRRQEYVETSKFKIGIIKEVSPYYTRISDHANALHNQLVESKKGVSLPDVNLCLYYICNILLIRRQIIQTYGAIQLDNIDAENAVTHHLNEIIKVLPKGLILEDLSRLPALVEEDSQYYKFLENVAYDDTGLSKRFVDLLLGLWRGYLRNEGIKRVLQQQQEQQEQQQTLQQLRELLRERRGEYTQLHDQHRQQREEIHNLEQIDESLTLLVQQLQQFHRQQRIQQPQLSQELLTRLQRLKELLEERQQLPRQQFRQEVQTVLEQMQLVLHEPQQVEELHRLLQRLLGLTSQQQALYLQQLQQRLEHLQRLDNDLIDLSILDQQQLQEQLRQERRDITDLEKLVINLKCFSWLLTFELNYVYKVWYRKGIEYKRLPQDVIDYLKQMHDGEGPEFANLTGDVKRLRQLSCIRYYNRIKGVKSSLRAKGWR
jgi:signal transduction histidine kinase